MKRTFLMALMTVVGILRASGSDDLILWWNFEQPDGQTFRDASDHERTGAAFEIGAGQIVLRDDGKIGAAIELQGEGRNFVKSDLVDETVFPGGSFTLELWVKDLASKAAPGSNLGSVIAMQRSDVNVAWSLSLSADGSLRFFTNTEGAPSIRDMPAISWEAGVWYRIVLSCRAEDENGHYRLECFKGDRRVLSETFEAPAPRMEGKGSFIVGGDHASTSPDRNLSGWLDEVRYFKSSELPSASPLSRPTNN